MIDPSSQQSPSKLPPPPLILAECDCELRYRWIRNPHPDFDANELVGKRDDELADKEGLRRLMALKRRALDSGSRQREEIDFDLSDGTRTYDVVIESLDDPTGAVVGILSAALDVTERKRVEAALEQRERQLWQLNESLEQRIAARTEQLERQTGQLRQLAREVVSAGHRERKRAAAVLHDDVQQYLVAAKFRLSRIKRQQKTHESAEILLAIEESIDLLERAMDLCRSLSSQLRPPVLYDDGLVPALRWLAQDMRERHHMRVEIDADESEEPLDEDLRALMFESARELLFNVVKHSEVKNAVVALRRSPGQLRLTVSDDGTGFDTTEDFTGSGLFGIRERIDPIGGSMHLSSEPGQGTTVTLNIPVAGDGGAAGPPEMAQAQPAVGSTLRVLVVEDHELVRTGLINLLNDEDRLEVVADAKDGAQAIKMVAQHSPEVVLLDVNMPGMSGIEVARRLRQSWPHIWIVGMSVQDDPATVQSMLQAGADTFVSKADDAQTLIEALLRPR